MPHQPQSQPSFLIVGAGVYGASTALTLARLGYRSITVLDRSTDGFAAPDAASNDVNKIARSAYSAPLYRNLAKEALSQWRTDPTISRFYHEVGLVLHSGIAALNGDSASGITDDAEAYVRNGVENSVEKGGFAELPRPGLKGFGKRQTGYIDPRGGWTEANAAVRAVLAEAIRLGVKVVPRCVAKELLYHDRPSSTGKRVVRGIRSADGKEYTADHTVIAAGAWSRLLLQQLLPGSSINALPPASPSAQCVVLLQLTPEERAVLKHAPVVLNFDTGLYVFEPTADGVLKMAIHSAAGYQNPAPRLDLETAYPTFQQGEERHCAQPSAIYKESADQFVPEDKVRTMLEELYTLYPLLRAVPAERIRTRICWYSDTLDENWVLDHHPDVDNLVVAGGDSGHGYKFLPTLGRLVAAKLGVEGVPELTPYQQRVFSFEHHRELAEKVKRGEKVESADSGRAPGGGAAAGKPVAERTMRMDKSATSKSNPRARL
ncbi:uncharacterized protein PFL1_00690 [Pseudozyma flocculosa PF-1]|uniref:uncharacterized protein n=1 Tax=Pseudozyma flocculosa PF-1 TaxID=1277687 RepID=UPI0004560720|nr:uncharacterized protein PFL1_00690 [Pseudozyma flocculosa PF-1]EPQ31355.1 hypothetical protein PFL1_00690 [Pseudozyma flocculosa PF-1]